jgi:hypothetical protein
VTKLWIHGMYICIYICMYVCMYVCKVRSVLQYIIMPQTDLTLLIYMIAFKSVAWIQSAQYWIQCQTRVNKAINLWVPKQRISYYKLFKKVRLALIQSCARFEAVPAVTTKTSSGMWRRVVWKIYIYILPTDVSEEPASSLIRYINIMFYFLTLLFLTLQNVHIKGPILFLCTPICHAFLCALHVFSRCTLPKASRNFLANYSSTLKIEAGGSSETSVHIYHIKWRHILEESII